MKLKRGWLILAVALSFASSASAIGLPKRVGECVLTKVGQVETRLVNGSTNQPIPGSGSAIKFENGGYQVSYQQERPVDRSHPGDPVRMCLVSIPRGCPPGDNRGRVYRTTNLRTHGSWTLPDAEHMCGGA
jgi:hypothetical protein